ncbi:uncharacterized protein LOC141851914 isoform X3 [Brevipalpus obovatus]|uniref:uncharacterized protein LOC141851914 isoform X3 n=1 Tax=Brevipalpus obovatus TaxID=246614 RepID=UPI003D9EBEB3
MMMKLCIQLSIYTLYFSKIGNTNTHDIRASNLGSKWWKPHTDLDQSGKDRLARVVQEFYEQKLGKELMVDKLISMEQQLPRTSGNSTFRITAALVDKENPEEKYIVRVISDNGGLKLDPTFPVKDRSSHG